MLRTVRATRYVTPLREGGSLPAIVEADDLGLYVVKFRGAGQGPLALVAELVAGEIGRSLGLMVPELVFIDIDPALGRNEPDAEIRQLLQVSTGLNVALDYLPGSTMFDPAAGDRASNEIASMAVWFDAFIMNVDRTARNPNLLNWHKTLYFIDHGAALYFQHHWATAETVAASPFASIRNHVLLPWAADIAKIAETACGVLSGNQLEGVLENVPEEWLAASGADRTSYVKILSRRLAESGNFVQEAIGARAAFV